MKAAKLSRIVSSWFTRTSYCIRWLISWSVIRRNVRSLRRRRIPVMLQLAATECGAACLAMILTYFGRKTPVSECRERCSVGRDGLTARTIAHAARSYGLRVKAYSVELADFKYVPLPAIAHWEFKHFVVVERWSPKRVEIVDPAAGRRQLTLDEFDAGFTGVVLTLEPGVQFQPSSATAQPIWRQYLDRVWRTPGTPGLLGQILGASLLLQVLGLALPLFTQVMVDWVLPFRITNVMTLLGLAMAIVVLAQLVLVYLRGALLVYLEGRLDSQLMLGFFEHVLSLRFRFFQQRSSGDLLLRLGSNMFIRETLTSQTLSTVLDGTFALVYLTILLVQAPLFGILALGTGLLQAALLLGTTRRVHDLTQRDLLARAESHSYLVEALMGIATLKACGAEERTLDHWSNLFFRQLNVSLQRSHLSAVVDTALMTLRAFAPLMLLWFGALRVLDGHMSLGTMLALNVLAVAFLTPMASLVSNGRQLQLVGAHLDRIADVLKAKPEQDPQEVPYTPQLAGWIELKHVSFRYDPDAPCVLRDISLAIEPGQKVALVGRTGSGKSTLAMLLLGLYTVSEGEILYDGIPLEQLNYRALRSQFGVVLQEPFLFSGSIRQNITSNDPNLSLEHVVDAAQLALIHDEVLQMPMGYETILTEGGVGLSGGQRQRLSIARALARKPAILLLDEATSQLDVITESLIDRNLSDMMCTRIVIAHRLSTIRNADLILVLDQGRIVERGRHEELQAQGEYYAALVHDQLGSEPPPAVEAMG